MTLHRSLVFFFLFLSCFALSSWALPLCSDSRAPSEVNSTLSFCPYKGKTCCNTMEDSNLMKQFQAMNISDKGCASVVKSILCAKCDPFSSDLFRDNLDQQSVPILCNSTSSANSTEDFCSETWETCQNVSISGSLFAASLQGRAGAPANNNASKLADVWQSKTDFCSAFGGASSNETVCFSGEPVALNDNDTTPDKPPSGLCLEKIGNGSYLNMVPHPDGSNRAFFSTQPGIVFLAGIPDQDSGGVLDVDPSSPFVDLTDEIHYDTEFGMMGMAFHPKFAQNGRFFASFNCDKSKWPGCTGRCSCNSDVNCDPSKLTPDSGSQPCQFQTVIAEYTANGTSSDPSKAKNAKPTEVRRIFTMGLPFTSHHAGQILFGPDGHLYFMMGDGGGGADPYNFSQNKKSLLGKIMRLDVDNIPSASEISKMGLWGNYSIPKDNPFREDKELEPEIWAVGLRNPWRCSFDSSRPSYFMCADVGQDTYEEVDLITKGGNYGWRVYEGPDLFHPDSSPGGNTSVKSLNPIFPVMGYNHSEVDSSGKSASITGGYFYRSETDPCIAGMYVYADLYGNGVWAGIETPANSGNFVTNRTTFSCAGDSPMKCSDSPGTSGLSLGYVFSFGEDNNKDIYLLTSNGVYRVVRPSRCNLTCSKENSTAARRKPSPSSSPSSSSSCYKHINGFHGSLVVLFVSLSLILLGLLN
ncbi:Soluble quinoprotein glucose/sorbosone dehydrogenase [Arabidopsis suecica]|uniref:Soluble quinoprotein glucose/sorbosone dehydrogenase n=1 Tax=Arabidopsis suecica TaxID=45249 RepID=A0A8T2BVZ1_ARASU|nr:Soluble quinoprotein glucose/sorbosone dehydrogenase [Arabidopsis suecica]